MNQIKSTCIYNFLFKKRIKNFAGTKYLYIAQKTGACVFNACIKCKIRYPIRTQVQWFIFYAITQS